MENITIVVRDLGSNEDYPLFVFQGTRSVEIMETENSKIITFGVSKTEGRIGVEESFRDFLVSNSGDFPFNN
jgi:hypothetical protein